MKKVRLNGRTRPDTSLQPTRALRSLVVRALKTDKKLLLNVVPE